MSRPGILSTTLWWLPCWRWWWWHQCRENFIKATL